MYDRDQVIGGDDTEQYLYFDGNIGIEPSYF